MGSCLRGTFTNTGADETDHARRVQVGESQAQTAIACAR
jgi:hypothetical protein